MERGKTSGRVDDNEETIRKRLNTYKESELPVVEHFEKLDKVKKVLSFNCYSLYAKYQIALHT